VGSDDLATKERIAVFGALRYVGLIGYYVEFYRLDGEDEVIVGGIVAGVEDQLPDWVMITLLNDDTVTIERDQPVGIKVFQRAPWLTAQWTPEWQAASDAAATRYDDEHCAAFAEQSAEHNGDPVEHDGSADYSTTSPMDRDG
jgi:hypothetical protein